MNDVSMTRAAINDVLDRQQRQLETLELLTDDDRKVFGLLRAQVDFVAAQDRVALEFERAVDNSTRHLKRSLLDFVDFWIALLEPDDVRARKLAERLKQRIHNDVSQIQPKVLAAFRIYTTGGVIPAFGRTETELDEPANVAVTG